MLDPVTSIGLAASVIQLIAFTKDLLDKSEEVQGRIDGALLENSELETITRSLLKLSGQLSVPQKKNTTKPDTKLDPVEKEISELCDGCKNVAQSLVEALTELKSDGNRNRWRSFNQALRCIWNERKINDIVERLERYRRQIDTLMLVSIR
jgi:hypothetical protein